MLNFAKKEVAVREGWNFINAEGAMKLQPTKIPPQNI